MKATNVTTTAAQIAAGNPSRKFLHIQNVSDTDIYVSYDGDATALTTSNGLKVAAGDTLMLNNDGTRCLFEHAVYAIHGGSGNKEVRIQGEGA